MSPVFKEDINYRLSHYCCVDKKKCPANQSSPDIRSTTSRKLTERDRNSLDPFTCFWIQALQRFQYLRMSHTASEICPTIGLALYLPELLLLLFIKGTTRRAHQARHVELNLLS